MRIRDARGEYLRWLRDSRGASGHTILAYGADTAALGRHLGPEAPVTQIDREALVGFIEVQRSAGLSTSTLRRRNAGVRSFCSWLVARELLDDDPSAGLVVIGRRSRRLPRVVPKHDLDRLFALLLARAKISDTADLPDVSGRPHDATTLLAVSLMVVTGVRVHEVVGIRCSDIDLAGRSLRLLGKGARERQVFLANEWVVGLTRAYMRTREMIEIDHGRLLFNLHGAPLTPAAMRGRLAKSADAAGISSRVTPHMLRHTAATQLIEAGVDIRYIQRLLGHASLSTTEIYTHVSDGALKRVVSEADILGQVVQVR